MFLCYRGVSYPYRSTCIVTRTGNIIGKYRGIEVRSQYLEAPIPQPIQKLTYRGVPYVTGIRQVAKPIR